MKAMSKNQGFAGREAQHRIGDANAAMTLVRSWRNNGYPLRSARIPYTSMAANSIFGEYGLVDRRGGSMAHASRQQTETHVWATTERWVQRITWFLVVTTILVDVVMTFGPRFA